MNKKSTIILYLSIVVGFSIVLVQGAMAQDASEPSMFLTPSTGVYVSGDTFSVDVVLDTDTEKITAAEGTISFDTEYLSATDISYNDSIFDSWIIEPEASNITGKINFAGTTTNSLAIDEQEVLTVKFKVLQEGTTKVRFASGAMLAGNEEKTNIVSSLISGSYTLTSQVNEFAPEPEYIPATGTPSAPVVSSSTHPNEDKWYSGKGVELFWSVPSDVIAVRMLMNQRPTSIPTVYYPYPIKEKGFTNLDEGVWYFHLQLRNIYGWGGVAHFKVNIDSEKPTHFTLNELDRTDPTDPRAKFIFDSFDTTSGISKYEVQISGQEVEDWHEEGNQIHKTPPLEPGNYTLVAKAIDAAGNYIVDAVDFEILPISPPVFKEFPEVIRSGDPLVLKGDAKPNSDISIWIKEENSEAEKYRVFSSETGAFTFVAPETPQEGVYEVWASVTDSRGASSNNSDIKTFAVRPPTLLYLGSLANQAMSTIIPLTALLFLLVALVYYMHHKFTLFRASLQKEVEEAEIAVHKAFYTLKKEADRNLKLLETVKDKRGLTKEELAVMDGLKGNLSKVERIIEKEVEDIEDTLNVKKEKRKEKDDKNNSSKYEVNLRNKRNSSELDITEEDSEA
ncbi:MAG: cohesin domain-containing protein [Candidatus Spechtbacterales bacterium]|nr:cohesin domain-containing protein [Candidatus Spechtbacterales bacterium]